MTSGLDKNGDYTDIVSVLREVAQIKTGLLYSRRLMLNQAASTIETLTRERDEVLAVHARTKSAIEVAYERRLKRYRSGCACHVNDDDELAGICGLHQQLVEDTRNAALEEAAKLLDGEADRAQQVWDDFIASGKDGPASSYHAVPRKYAAAIRALAGGKQE